MSDIKVVTIVDNVSVLTYNSAFCVGSSKVILASLTIFAISFWLASLAVVSFSIFILVNDFI